MIQHHASCRCAPCVATAAHVRDHAARLAAAEAEEYAGRAAGLFEESPSLARAQPRQPTAGSRRAALLRRYGG